MPMMIWANGQFRPISQRHPAGPYEPVEIGRPLAIELRTFFPGTDRRKWGNKSELMISSQTRVGPSNEPAPRMVNLLVYRYGFDEAEPVQDIGGDIYGDLMLHYTRACAGQKIGFTLHGTEFNQIGRQTLKKISHVLGKFGNLALFSSAAPYLAAAGLTAQMAQTLAKAFNRPDRLTTARQDLYLREPNANILQSGRYVAWYGYPTTKVMAQSLRLTSPGDDSLNILVHRNNDKPFRANAYFVLQIDGKERTAYEDFEIGAGSARLLQDWGASNRADLVLAAIGELAAHVNDAKQLAEIEALSRKLRATRSEATRKAITARLKAHTELLSTKNGDLLRKLLKI